jgi:hypothetical protein
MHSLLALLLALKSATVIEVRGNHEVTLALQVGDVIFTAEFSRPALKPGILVEGDHVAAEVRDWQDASSAEGWQDGVRPRAVGTAGSGPSAPVNLGRFAC